VDRRTFLAGVTATLAAGCIPVGTDYGPLVASAVPGLWIPRGFTARKVATSWERVAGYTWHGHPDGGACFEAGDQWVYVSNSEADAGQGGVSALRFDRAGATVGAYRILSGTSRNCAGGRYWLGARWWWVSCEETDRGQAWLCDPLRASQGSVLPWGRFRREAVAHHLPTNTVYQSEDEPDGCLYRWDVAAAHLEVLTTGGQWKVVPDPEATTTATRYQVPDARRFNGGEGIAVAGDLVLLCAKGDGRTWRYNIATGLLDVVYDPQTSPGARHLATGDNLVATTTSAFVAEDGGNMEIVGLNLKTGATTPVVRYDCAGSEMTGPSFSPDRRHLLFSSQRKPGVTFMVTGPWT
jgi:hypothetical protein